VSRTGEALSQITHGHRPGGAAPSARTSSVLGGLQLHDASKGRAEQERRRCDDQRVVKLSRGDGFRQVVADDRTRPLREAQPPPPDDADGT
jgi:hypothetical protein